MEVYHSHVFFGYVCIDLSHSILTLTDRIELTRLFSLLFYGIGGKRAAYRQMIRNYRRQWTAATAEASRSIFEG